jgi:hypothetical protein
MANHDSNCREAIGANPVLLRKLRDSALRADGGAPAYNDL